MKIKEFFKNHKKLVIFLCIALVVVGGIVYISSKVKKASEELLNTLTAGSAAKVTKMDLVDSLAATGKIASLENTDIVSLATGVKVVSVEVEDGDEVKAGDVICILDSEELTKKLEEAKISLNVTETKTNSNVAIAKRGLSESQVTEAVQVSRDFEDADDYYQDYLKALDKLDEAKREYDTATNFYNFRVKEYEDYKAEYPDLDEYSFLNRTERGSYYKGNMTSAESDMKAKKSTVDSRQDAVDAALTKYENLVRSYEDHVRNDDSAIMSKNDSLNNAKLDTQTATISTDQQIRQLELQISECTVLAPCDGIITGLNVHEGAVYAGGSIANVSDVSKYRIVAEIDEFDIAKVKEGERVIIKTNGTGDLELDGEVVYVAPTATKAANGSVATNVTYKVKIGINTQCDDLKLDMTAKISIIVSEADDVFTVPYDAVQTDDDGKFFIETVELDADGNMVPQVPGQERERIYVEKGIESDYYIQVIGEGIKDGLDVFVPSSNAGNSFMELLESQGMMGGF